MREGTEDAGMKIRARCERQCQSQIMPFGFADQTFLCMSADINMLFQLAQTPGI